MKITTLISTMNKIRPEELIKEMNIKEKYVIINQITDENIDVSPEFQNANGKIISYKGKGLSKSRNQAIDKANTEICVIADDDMYYVEDYCDIIKKAYSKYNNADIIAFVVEHEDKKNEKRIMKEGKVGFLKSMKISSVQLTINRNNLKNKKIRFDENFGAGSKYYMGEENIFLFDCIKKGLKIYYIPAKIASLGKSESTWFKGYTREYYNNFGAVYYRMTRIFYPFLILQYVIRKRKDYGKDLKPIQVLKYMFEGVKKYKNEKKDNLLYG